MMRYNELLNCFQSYTVATQLPGWLTVLHSAVVKTMHVLQKCSVWAATWLTEHYPHSNDVFMQYLQSAIDFQGKAASQIRWEQFASCCWAINISPQMPRFLVCFPGWSWQYFHRETTSKSLQWLDFPWGIQHLWTTVKQPIQRVCPNRVKSYISRFLLGEEFAWLVSLCYHRWGKILQVEMRRKTQR